MVIWRSRCVWVIGAELCSCRIVWSDRHKNTSDPMSADVVDSKRLEGGLGNGLGRRFRTDASGYKRPKRRISRYTSLEDHNPTSASIGYAAHDMLSSSKFHKSRHHERNLSAPVPKFMALCPVSGPWRDTHNTLNVWTVRKYSNFWKSIKPI